MFFLNMTQSKLQTLQPKFNLKPMTLPQIPDLVQSLFFVEAETVSGGQRQKDSKSEKAESGGHISGLEIGTIHHVELDRKLGKQPQVRWFGKHGFTIPAIANCD